MFLEDYILKYSQMKEKEITGPSKNRWHDVAQIAGLAAVIRVDRRAES